MSAFIGPIHYWLYSKIQIVNDRESFIYKKTLDACGDVAEEIREQVWQTYGQPLSNDDLAELIDHDNIHGWLQRQINLAESREAAFIKEILAIGRYDTKNIITEAFQEHGKIIGEKASAKSKYDNLTAKEIYMTLNDYYLNGMPCDQGDMIVESDHNNVVWETGNCLQEPNWKRVSIEKNIMLEFYQVWIKSFVKAVNIEFSFKNIQDTSGDKLIYQIYKL